MEQLTPSQQEVWNFILKHYRSQDTFPDYKTIQQECDITHLNSIYQYLSFLVEKNYLEKWGPGTYRIHPSKVSFLYENTDNSGIPILGRIAASGMKEAIEEPLGVIPIQLTNRARDIFALEVTGPSMNGAGIDDGDFILLEKRNTLNNGEIGAILYQGETSLKRISRENGKLIMKPENDQFESIVIEPGEFEDISIIGGYIGKATRQPEGWELFLQG